jgi:hypothetical protein
MTGDRHLDRVARHDAVTALRIVRPHDQAHEQTSAGAKP